MAPTVGLPAAIAACMLAAGQITLRGVHIPVQPQIYEPVLNELAACGIQPVERVYAVDAY